MRSIANRRRSGYVTILVIIAIAIVAGLSYSMLQSSKTMTAVERNLRERDIAKSAAHAGLEHAMASMHKSTWSGPNSNYQFELDENSGFEIDFQYEYRLAESDPDYWQQPYRVIVRSVGYCVMSDRKIQYAVSANLMLSDVRLNPSKAAFAVSPPPRTVTTVDRSVTSLLFPPKIEFWNRIEGSTHSVRGFDLWSTVQSSYRVDFLNEMTGPTWSPFAPVTDRCDVEDSSVISSFADAISILSLDLFQLPVIADGTKYAVAGSTYQIYRGGPLYSIPSYSGAKEKLDLLPDESNPWGIYRGIGNLQFGKECTFAGTICMNRANNLTFQEKKIVGQRILHTLPDGTNFEMPAAMAYTIAIESEKDISLTGTFIADSSFVHTPTEDKANCTVLGRIYCDYFSLETYKPSQNNTSKKDPDDLADFVESCDLPDEPFCTITDLQPSQLHWQDTSLPFLIPNTLATDGYRWSILSIEELGYQ